MNISDLEKPFPSDKIHWRVGATNKEKTKGIALAYIDARDVMERLDNVCGPGFWQCRYPFAGCCEIGIALPCEGSTDVYQWVWKSNGAGETDYEGTKGQYSDAFKRAAVLWGIGRYLYDLDSPWVEIEPRGKSYVIKKNELPSLNKLVDTRVYIPREQKKDFYNQILGALANGDDHALKELWAEWDSDEKVVLWGMFNSQQRSTMKEMMK